MKPLILALFLLSITVSGWAGNKGYITKESEMEKQKIEFMDDDSLKGLFSTASYAIKDENITLTVSKKTYPTFTFSQDEHNYYITLNVKND